MSESRVSKSSVSESLVTVGLPVRNGAERIERVAKSVLAQDHEQLQLLISDNASTDGTEELVRDLAKADSRIIYHRHPENVGLFNNFVGTMRLAEGEFFRWVSDDDWLEPTCVSRSLQAFGADDRLLLVTAQISYTGDDGVTQTADYQGTKLSADDPIERFTEMLRMLNQSHLLIDPLYGLFRRAPAAAIERRNMLREDEVFATKLALAGPWGHVPEVLAHRNWKHESPSVLARRLDVPSWQAHFATTLQCREMLRWLNDAQPAPGLTAEQRRRARAAVLGMWSRRQQRVAARRGRRLWKLVSRR